MRGTTTNTINNSLKRLGPKKKKKTTSKEKAKKKRKGKMMK
jgi:hypothetical protein